MTMVRKILLAMLSIAAVSFAVIRGPGIIEAKAKESRIMSASIKQLSKNSRAMSDAGFVPPDNAGTTGEEISAYDLAIESSASLVAAAQSRDGALVMKTIRENPEEYQKVLAQLPQDRFTPHHDKDAANIARVRTATLFLDALDQYAKSCIQNGEFEEAKTSIETALTFLNSSNSDVEERAQSLTFGTYSDFVNRYYEIIASPQSTVKELEWVIEKTTDFQHPYNLTDLYAAHIFERFQAMDQFKKFEDDEWSTLNIEGNNELEVPVTGAFIKANRSTMAKALLDGKAIIEKNSDLEVAGADLDHMLIGIQNSEGDFKGPAYYMLRTASATFELSGRGIMRINQAMAGINALANKKLAEKNGSTFSENTFIDAGFTLTPDKSTFPHFPDPVLICEITSP
ncbi:MAG: hypothetical protein R2688_08420 [Fimbriimonadaceae bacterium]